MHPTAARTDAWQPSHHAARHPGAEPRQTNTSNSSEDHRSTARVHNMLVELQPTETLTARAHTPLTSPAPSQMPIGTRRDAPDRSLFVSRACSWARLSRGLSGGRSVGVGSGSDFTEEPAVRVQSRPRWPLEPFPSVLPGPSKSGSGVGDELAVDGVADASFPMRAVLLCGSCLRRSCGGSTRVRSCRARPG